jgi:hypothetical protein
MQRCSSCGADNPEDTLFCGTCRAQLPAWQVAEKAAAARYQVEDPNHARPDGQSSMKCPHCGLINPSSASRCDCGFDFLSGEMKESYLPRRTTAGLATTKWYRPAIVATLVACALAFAAGLLILDAALFWLPDPYSRHIFAADWKEMSIGSAMLSASLLVAVFFARRMFTIGRAMRRYGYLFPTLVAFTLGLQPGIFFQWRIERANWFTSNSVVVATVRGQKEARLLRNRVLMVLPKPPQVLKIRVTNVDWRGVAAGTRVQMSNGHEGEVTSDVVGVRFSLEVRNISSSPTRLSAAPYIGAGKKTIFAAENMVLKEPSAASVRAPVEDLGVGLGNFPDDGIAFNGGETKVLRFESGDLKGYEDVEGAGDLFVMNGDYDDWHQPLGRLPARELVFPKSAVQTRRGKE